MRKWMSSLALVVAGSWASLASAQFFDAAEIQAACGQSLGEVQKKFEANGIEFDLEVPQEEPARSLKVQKLRKDAYFVYSTIKTDLTSACIDAVLQKAIAESSVENVRARLEKLKIEREALQTAKRNARDVEPSLTDAISESLSDGMREALAQTFGVVIQAIAGTLAQVGAELLSLPLMSEPEFNTWIDENAERIQNDVKARVEAISPTDLGLGVEPTETSSPAAAGM